MFTLPSGFSVIPVENPAPARPVRPPTGALSRIVPVKPFKLVMVNMVSAQYPNGITTLLGLADTAKSGFVARTGLVRPMLPNNVSDITKTITVLDPAPVRKTLYLLALIILEGLYLDT